MLLTVCVLFTNSQKPASDKYYIYLINHTLIVQAVYEILLEINEHIQRTTLCRNTQILNEKLLVNSLLSDMIKIREREKDKMGQEIYVVIYTCTYISLKTDFSKVNC